MNFYSKISIQFDCYVAEGGYSLESSLIKTNKKESYFDNSYSLIQKNQKTKTPY